MILGPYRALLRRPHARRLVAAALLGRLPLGITSLALVLLVHREYGSYGQAGATAAAFAIGGGLAAPLEGRMIDRLGQSRVLLPTAAVNAAAIAGVVLTATNGGSLILVDLLAAIAGAAIPPLSACLRTLWSAIVEAGPRLDTAYALESITTEIFFVSGPLVTAGLVAVSSPAAALLTGAAMSVVGTAAFAASPVSRHWRSDVREAGSAGALASPGMRTLTLTILPSAVAFGTFEVAMPAFAGRHGSPAAGGVMLAAFALGSMLGGLWYGSREWHTPLEHRYVRLTALFALGLAIPPLAHSFPLMLVFVTIAGLTLAPIVACSYALIDRVAPAGTATEAYTWLSTANVAGSAVGAALAGLLIDQVGVHWALAAACAGAALGAAIAFARRATIREPAPVAR